MPHSQVNWVAILVTAALGLLVGVAWAALRARLSSHARPVDASTPGTPGSAMAYVVAFLCSFVTAYLMSRLADYVFRDAACKTTANGLILGALVWVGFVGPTGLTAVVLGREPLPRFLIEALHHLPLLLMMGILLTVWQ